MRREERAQRIWERSLPAIKELELIIEASTQHGEQHKVSKQRPRNSRRSDIERTMREEKKERLNRTRMVEKEVADRETTINKKRGRGRHAEESNHQVPTSSYNTSTKGEHNTTSDGTESTQTTGKRGKVYNKNEKKLLSKSQIKRRARRGGQTHSEPEDDGYNKYRIGEVSSK